MSKRKRRAASPETRAKMVEAHKARWARRRAAGLVPAPTAETLATRREAGRLAVQRHKEAHPYAKVLVESRARARAWGVACEPVSEADVEALLVAQGGRCAACFADLGPRRRDKHLDHKVPFCRGGGHVLNNLAWLCPECNYQKAGREFFANPAK